MWKLPQKYFFYVKNSKIATYSFITYSAAFIILIALLVGLWIYRCTSVPKYREFSNFDISIINSYYPDSAIQVGNIQMVLFNGIFTALQLGSILFFNKRWRTLTKSRWGWNVVIFILGLLLSLVINFGLVFPLKTVLAVFRPDFVSRCSPLPNVHPEPGRLLNVLACTATYPTAIIRDGAMAFPSGLSAIIANNLTYAALLKKNNFQSTNVWINYGPFLIAGMISTWHISTRFSDNRSSLLDLFAGAVIGVLSSNISFWFLFDTKTGFPLPPYRYGFEFNIHDEGGCYRFEGDKFYHYDDAISFTIDECCAIQQIKAKQASEERPSKIAKLAAVLKDRPMIPVDEDEEPDSGNCEDKYKTMKSAAGSAAAQSLRFPQQAGGAGTPSTAGLTTIHDQGSKRVYTVKVHNKDPSPTC
ncbi:hypothetical protein WICPIJ_005692 [Wickerhamomyces pijperi]|uniref:Phosphatidic acid phosphatase type 2/haloperoxidase domain-containing protein n=1 Tax=Wickerhamomyces pijperi TaxID=599730 RepID=A0A9P8Q5F9_WICPI|nr:hypothetical protein WICPIJ_005692 [Wickerhamomyces pijperi]